MWQPGSQEEWMGRKVWKQDGVSEGISPELYLLINPPSPRTAHSESSPGMDSCEEVEYLQDEPTHLNSATRWRPSL